MTVTNVCKNLAVGATGAAMVVTEFDIARVSITHRVIETREIARRDAREEIPDRGMAKKIIGHVADSAAKSSK